MQFRVRGRVEGNRELARAIECFDERMLNLILGGFIRLVGIQVTGLMIQFRFINCQLYSDCNGAVEADFDKCVTAVRRLFGCITTIAYG